MPIKCDVTVYKNKRIHWGGGVQGQGGVGLFVGGIEKVVYRMWVYTGWREGGGMGKSGG